MHPDGALTHRITAGDIKQTLIRISLWQAAEKVRKADPSRAKSPLVMTKIKSLQWRT
jgi:hypothetical protein